MTEDQFPYERGRPSKRVFPHHTNSWRQDIKSKIIRFWTTNTQVETFLLSESGAKVLEDQLEKMEVNNQG
jgi:hypothetical protein